MNKTYSNKYPSLKPSDFDPSPIQIFEKIVLNSNVIFAFIHGSFIYKEELPGATYRDTRVFNHNNEFVESRFDLVLQSPDLDAVVCVKDPDKFKLDINKFKLRLLNYFLTINVVSHSVLNEEIIKSTPTAMKTILAFRGTLDYGDINRLKRAKSIATNSITDLDRKFQEQYDKRKMIYGENLLKGVESFIITREEYSKDFPLLLKSYEGRLEAAFPKKRLKLVYPHDMGLKRQIILGQEKNSVNLL